MAAEGKLIPLYELNFNFVNEVNNPTIYTNPLRSGGGQGGNDGAGGGGAGGVVYAALDLPSGSYTINIGAGGAQQFGSRVPGNKGGDTSITGFTLAIGGGYGGVEDSDYTVRNGGPGGSGGVFLQGMPSFQQYWGFGNISRRRSKRGSRNRRKKSKK